MSTFRSLAARPPSRGMLEWREGAVFPAGRPPKRFTATPANSGFRFDGGGTRVATRDEPCFHLKMATRAWMSWSSGKDSTFALQCVEPDIEVTGLLVTVNEEADRVAMHAVRRSLLEQQADRLGLPLHVV